MYFTRSVGKKITPAAGTCANTRAHTHASCIFFAYLASALSLTHTYTPAKGRKKSPQQVADSSHGCNIFALMAAGDVGDVCSEGPAWRSETPALCVMRPQSSCEEFPFSEAQNEDGCSLRDVFLLLASDSRSLFLSLALEHPQERPPPPLLFFPVYLPVSLSCQLFERPRTSSCGRPDANCHRAYLPPSTLAIKHLLSQRRRKRKLAYTPTLHSWAKKEL